MEISQQHKQTTERSFCNIKLTSHLSLQKKNHAITLISQTLQAQINLKINKDNDLTLILVSAS